MSFINWSEIDSPSELISAGTIALTIIIGYIGYFVAYMGKSSRSNYKATVDSQNSRISALEQETRECTTARATDKERYEALHKESIREIATLKGKVEVLETVPLKKIETESSEKLEILESMTVTLNSISQKLINHIDSDDEIQKSIDTKLDALVKKGKR